MPSWRRGSPGRAVIIYGSAAITAGTAMPMYGLRADGKSHPARMPFGWRRAMSVGTGDMCSSRGAGGKRENAANGQLCRGLPVAVVEMVMLAHINPPARDDHHVPMNAMKPSRFTNRVVKCGRSGSTRPKSPPGVDSRFSDSRPVTPGHSVEQPPTAATSSVKRLLVPGPPTLPWWAFSASG